MFALSGSFKVSMRIVLIVALLFGGFPFFWNPSLASAAEEADANVSFLWAFGVMSGTGDEARVEPVTSDTVLKTGDHFKMLVELKKKCFVYVVYHNAQDEVLTLFPYSLQQFVGNYETSRKYFIPQGEAWFELDEHTGRETFYLLASNQRLTGLEDLLTRYTSADPVKKPDITEQILAEIRNVRAEHREFATAAERPVPIGGAIRGIERAQGANRTDIDVIAEEITATDFYARTFTIEHR